MGFNVRDRKGKKSTPKHINKKCKTSLAQKNGIDRHSKFNESSDESVRSKEQCSLSQIINKMKPSLEELEFRKHKLDETDVVGKYSRYFKCTKCHVSFQSSIDNHEDISEHPFLGVLMCEDCCEYYGDGNFSLDSDGEDKYCRWCGEGGTLFTCSKCICGFCALCMKKHFGVEYMKKVQNDDDWLCLFCNPKPLWTKRFICSLAKEISSGEKQKQTPTPLGKKNFLNKLGIIANVQKSQSTSGNLHTLEELKSTPLSHQRSETPKQESEEESSNSVDSTPNEKKKINNYKRKLLSSSGEDSDAESTSKKKLKLTKRSPVITPSPQPSVNKLEWEAYEKLEMLLKLSEYQLGFGVKWSTRALKNLAKRKTGEDLKKDCQKIKWFLSLLSTRLVELCNSVDIIENDLIGEKGEKMAPHDDLVTEENSYTIVSKFLNFMALQVKAFRSKGFSFSEVLDSEIYEEANIIGIKKKVGSPRGKKTESPAKNNSQLEEVNENATESQEEGEEENKEEDRGNESDDESTVDLVIDQDAETDLAEINGSGEERDEELKGLQEELKNNTELKDILAILEHA